MSDELLIRSIGSALPWILIGWAVAAWLKRRRKADRLPRTPLIVGAVLGGLIAVTQVYIRNVSLSGRDSVEVMRVAQPANGSTEADLTAEYVEQSAAAILNGLKKEVPDFDAVASSSVVEKNGKRLGVIRFTIDNQVPWVSVIGISGDKMVRVTCSVSRLTDVDVNSPECSRALLADFGTTLDG